MKKDKFQLTLRLVLPPVLTVILTLLIFCLHYMYPFGLKSVAWTDMRYQIVPFLSEFKDILEGQSSIFWNFHNAGGMNFYGVFFYYLSSPFSLLVKFVPKEEIIWFTNVLIMLKMALAAFSAAYCLDYCQKRFSTPLLIILSLAYAFCGYTMMYYVILSWLDVVYLFPWVVTGLIRIIREQKTLTFIVSLFLSCWAHYYITCMVAVFIFIFWSVYSWFYHKDEKYAIIGQEILCSSLLAVLLSAVVCLPCYFQYTEAARSNLSLLNAIGKSRLFFNDYQTVCPMLMVQTLPLVLVLLGLFCQRTWDKQRKFYLTLSALLLVPFVVEPINLFWHLGNYISFPCRFGFMSIFMLILSATYFFREDLTKQKNGWIYLFALGIALIFLYFTGNYIYHTLIKEGYTLSSFVRTHLGSDESFAYIWKFSLLIALAYIGIYAIYLKGFISKNLLIISLVPFFLLEIYTNTYIYMYLSSKFALAANKFEYSCYKLSERIDDDSLFRVSSRYFSGNDNLIGAIGYNGLASYNSLDDRNTVEMMNSLGYKILGMSLTDKGGTLLSDALLGVKYEIGEGKNTGKEIYRKGNFYINKLPDTLPLGLVLSRRSLLQLANNLDRADVQSALSQALWDEDLIERYHFIEDVKRVDNFYHLERGKQFNFSQEIKNKRAVYLDLSNKFSTEVETGQRLFNSAEVFVNGRRLCNYPTPIDYGILHLGDFANEILKISVRFNKDVDCSSFCLFGLDMERLHELCQQARGANLNVKGSGFYGRCNVDKDSTLFLSVPYNDGFTVKVNGVKVPYNKALTGFISFDLPRGEDEIEITFVPKGFCLGMVISGLGLVLSFLYVKFSNKLNDCVRFNKVMAGVMVTISLGVFVFVYVVPILVKLGLIW